MSDIERHDLEWNDRLQDLIDGDVTGPDRAAYESHITGCARCRVQFARLKKLDAQLRARIQQPEVSAGFDQQVFARINALDSHARDRARRRIDRELQENLETLAKGWRRGMLSALAGAVAGAALAIALITWTNQTGIAGAVVSAASSEMGAGYSGVLHALLTISIGAAIGAAVSRWLTSTVE